MSSPEAVARAFLSPRRSPAARVPIDWPGALRHRVCFEGEELALVEAGVGSATLLVHGWEGQASDLDAIGRRLLAQGRRVLAIDLPAHGDSGGARTSIPASARAVLELSRHLGPCDAVVAHSLGSAITIVAMAGGLDVRSAVFLAAPAHCATYAREFARRAGLDAVQTRRMFELLLCEGVDVEALSTPALARTLRQPALFVHSSDDRVVPIEDAEAACAAWRGARLMRVDGLGHRRLLSDAHVVDAVADFIAAEARGRPQARSHGARDCARETADQSLRQRCTVQP